MPPLESTQKLHLGAPCPHFALPDVTTGRVVTDRDFAGRMLLVAFICNHCPFVIHVRAELARLSSEAAAHGDGCVFICSNDATTHPSDGPGPMREEVTRAGYAAPYLHDQTQETARAFDAACTPDFFLFDQQHRLVYAGRLDDSRPGNGKPVTGAELRAAMEATRAGRACAQPQHRSIGCSIKWRCVSGA